MSDQRLRELERIWKGTGSVEDEAAYLRERVRVGDLTQERLELAAYCGHEGAANASGVSFGPSRLVDWLWGLRALGRWAWVAGVHASLRPIPLTWSESAGRGAVLRLLNTIGDWCSGHTPTPAAPPPPEMPNWSEDWRSPSQHSYRAMGIVLKRLLVEISRGPQPEGQALVPARGTTPTELLVSLTTAGARASLGADGGVVLYETGTSLAGVVRAISEKCGVSQDAATHLALRASNAIHVIEAWDYGQYDGRAVISEFALLELARAGTY